MAWRIFTYEASFRDLPEIKVSLGKAIKHIQINKRHARYTVVRPWVRPCTRAANYCRTSDNVGLNLANVRAKVILIGHWSDQKNILSHYQ